MGSVFVVVEQAVEFEGEDAFEQVFFREPREFAADAEEVFVDFFVVDFHFFEAVGQVVELFLDDVLGRGHFFALEFFADDAFYLAELAFFARVDYGHGYACLSGSARTAGAVCVDGCVVGQAVVDHMGEVVDIEAAGGHVGGYEDWKHPVAEFFHHHVTLLL